MISFKQSLLCGVLSAFSFHSAAAYDRFNDKYELQTAASVYCLNPSAFSSTSTYAQYGPIESWDVSYLFDISNAFHFSDSTRQNCNPPIGNWDVSNVRDMNSMFRNLQGFNTDIGDWDVSKVIKMNGMFEGAVYFNQDISGWDVSNVQMFYNMFQNAMFFNQNIASWDVSSGLIFDNMFNNARKFSQDLSCWNMQPSASKNYWCGYESYCGDGNCVPTEEPTDAPSVSPTFAPTDTSDLCKVMDVYGQTIFVPALGACWRIQLALGGTIERQDGSDCSDISKWKSSMGDFSVMGSIDPRTAHFSKGTNGFSGTAVFKEDTSLAGPSLNVLSFDPATGVFAIEITLTTCAADAICPVMLVDL